MTDAKGDTTLVRNAGLTPVAWKNGAGSTREYFRQVNEEGEVLVRISIAEITGAQPFSAFPGVDRIILQLVGPRMTLVIDGKASPLTLHAPLAFPGEAEVTCSLEEEGRAFDLNLMCRRGIFRPSMRLVQAREGERLPLDSTSGLSALLCLSPCRVDGALDASLNLHDLVLCQPGRAALRVDRDTRFVALSAELLPEVAG